MKHFAVAGDIFRLIFWIGRLAELGYRIFIRQPD